MARPTVIRDEQILDAARIVFLERGVLATTAEVAQRAKVSEGSLFKRFKTKAELFRVAMGFDLEDVPRTMAELESRAGHDSVEENLVAAALSLLQFFDRVLPLMMMQLSNPKMASGCHIPGYEGQVPPPLRAQAHLAAYLEAERAIGRIGELDAQVVARAFLGAMSTYVFYENLAKGSSGAPLDAERYARGYVRTLAGGLLPRPAAVAVVTLHEPERKPKVAKRAAATPAAHALQDRA
jgi:AcrR family transcriptional regulator